MIIVFPAKVGRVYAYLFRCVALVEIDRGLGQGHTNRFPIMD
jgi:hypothetical protein